MHIHPPPSTNLKASIYENQEGGNPEQILLGSQGDFTLIDKSLSSHTMSVHSRNPEEALAYTTQSWQNDVPVGAVTPCISKRKVQVAMQTLQDSASAEFPSRQLLRRKFKGQTG